MTIQEYLHSLKGKRVAVIGVGVSNTPLIRLLRGAGIDVTACDKKDRAALGALADELEAEGCRLRLGEDYLEGLDHDVIFRTPGLHPRYLAAARERGSHVTSEMEVFFSVCPCPIIGITGSDGKTTTTTIIAGLLRAAGKTVHLGGNIGHPLLAEAETIRPEDVAVVELSSFQLMTMQESPGTAVLTNLAPNHLDIHTDMEEYVEAKRLLKFFDYFLTVTGDGTVTRSSPTPLTGEPGVTLSIEADGGTVLRNSAGSTTLRAVVYSGPSECRTPGEVRAAFGEEASVEWCELGPSGWEAIGPSDPRLSEGGMALTVSGTEVSGQATYRCRLVVIDENGVRIYGNQG